MMIIWGEMQVNIT
jgi:hypothetical protein